ncbi:helix-turn-helix domain-containing protein [Agromyces sp. LHK192]|uniref:AraC family transcriptional regulator n=1 Tax=Agromyces sp. LHK192 TaxID=2498704 RepID=UPI0013E39677|nr:helix-turn-helix domain-containing protein [Agromyces sp. LHK192]
MIHEERDPPSKLAGIVVRAWFLETQPARRFEKILPMPFAHLIVNLSTSYRQFDAGGVATEVSDAFVSGLQSGYLVIESPALIRHVGLELAPTGFHALGAAAPAATAGRVTDARAVFGGVDELVQRLRTIDRPTEAVDALLDFAEERTPAAGGPRYPLVEAALEEVRTDPDIRIGPLAMRLGVSHRALLARVRAVTGTTLKHHAQVQRFHRFIDAVHAAGGRPDWAGLAAASGYYDQPDVIRAFRRFSGWTPAEYYRLVAEHGPEVAHFVPLDQVPAS